MAIRKIFEDAAGNQMEFALDGLGDLVFEVGQLRGDSAPYYSGNITLSREDVVVLIEELKIILEKMPK